MFASNNCIGSLGLKFGPDLTGLDLASQDTGHSDNKKIVF
jgi:hypothetical protein